MTTYSTEEIARVIHAANSELQNIQNDPSPSPPWDSQSEEIREFCIKQVGYVDWLARIMSPEEAACESHQEWYRNRLKSGWTLGNTKDPEQRTHPCLLPWEKLPEPQRDKSRMFVAIVKTMTSKEP